LDLYAYVNWFVERLGESAELTLLMLDTALLSMARRHEGRRVGSLLMNEELQPHMRRVKLSNKINPELCEAQSELANENVDVTPNRH